MNPELASESSNFDRIDKILELLLLGEPEYAQQKVIFSGKSLQMIIHHFSKVIKKAEIHGDTKLILSRWEKDVIDLRNNLINSAIDAESFVPISNHTNAVLIREDDARNISGWCPDGPGNYLRHR